MSGYFIVLDGPDGSGTTLQTKLLVERLADQKNDLVVTAQPSTGPIGKHIRQLLSGEDIGADALQLLFVADRAWHVQHVIKPALAEGKIVICDRYIPSTLVYGKALGLNTEWLTQANSVFPTPDATIFTLPPLSVCLERIGRRKQKDNLEATDIQKRVHSAYQEIADEQDIFVLDTSGGKQETADRLFAHLTDKFGW